MVNLKTDKLEPISKEEAESGGGEDENIDQGNEEEIILDMKTRSGKKVTSKRGQGVKRSRDSSDEEQNAPPPSPGANSANSGESSDDEEEEEESDDDSDKEYEVLKTRVSSGTIRDQRRSPRAKKAKFDGSKAGESWILSKGSSTRSRRSSHMSKPHKIKLIRTRETRHSISNSARKSYEEIDYEDDSEDDDEDDDEEDVGEEEEDEEDDVGDEEEDEGENEEEEENRGDEEMEGNKSSKSKNEKVPQETRKSTRHKNIENGVIGNNNAMNSSPKEEEDSTNEIKNGGFLSPSLRVTRQKSRQAQNDATPNNIPKRRNTNNSRSTEYDDKVDNSPSSTMARYPMRERRHHQNQEDAVKTENDNVAENSYATRKSRRVSSKSNERSGSNSEQPIDKDTEGDMYSRLKRRTRTTINFSFNENRMSSSRKESAEPVARRLRERKSTQGTIAERPSSLIENFIAKDNRRRHRRRYRRNNRRSASSDDSDSSSSDDSTNKDVSRGSRGPRQSPHERPEKVGSKKGFVDIQPIQVDPSITFESVGGLEAVIEKLREIVVLPLVYKDFYTDRNIIPPRGILFHGPPGTGKTLLARALANECSDVGGRKVSFFVRKGADLLNKWVGESERHLRQLFEQASRCQPSIIFFDEIDGLAPARSSKTDQVHNSIVSTLLAELDGVRDRGDIIIVGATNRIDSLDPALRRPGRFDHEFAFLLPTKEGRTQIIKSHVSKWKGDEVSKNVIEELARRCVGFSGADLKLLCAEASMCALRRQYPQIYLSKQKYLLDYNSIRVGPSDWFNAMKKVNRSSDRSVYSVIAVSKPLPKAVKPLLKREVENIAFNLKKLYTLNQDDSLTREPAPKRFLIYTRHGHEDNGVDQYIVPALLHIFEYIPVFTLSLESFSLQDTNVDCKTIAQVFAEASRVNKFAIVLIPSLNVILKMISEQSREVLYQRMMTTEKPILVIATAQPQEEDLSDNILNFFNGFSHQVRPATRDCRKSFFRPVFGKDSLRHRVRVVKQEPVLEDIPLAPPPPPKMLSAEELKPIIKKENSMLRSLRKFLREVLAKLARNKKFDDFTRPVDVNEVKDYLDIIQHPMDFETMMCKLDQGVYNSARDFLDDIHLIRDNAVSYNPTTTFEGKSIIHRAYELADYAHLIIEDEMDSDFEEACIAITEARKERENLQNSVIESNSTTAIPTTSNTTDKTKGTERVFRRKPSSDSAEGSLSKNSDDSPSLSNDSKRRIRGRGKYSRVRGSSSSSKGDGDGNNSRTSDTNMNLNEIVENNNDSDNDHYEDSVTTNDFCGHNAMETITINSDTEGDDSFSNEFSEGLTKFENCPTSEEYQNRLDELLDAALNVSENMGILRLLDFRYQLLFAVESNYDSKDKKKLLVQLGQVIKHFSNAYSASPKKSNVTVD